MMVHTVDQKNRVRSGRSHGEGGQLYQKERRGCCKRKTILFDRKWTGCAPEASMGARKARRQTGNLERFQDVYV